MALTLRVESYLGAPPALDQQQVIAEAGATVGRGVGCTLTLADPARKVSRTHAEIRFRDGQYVWSQLGENATLINDHPVTKGLEQVLSDGDRLAVGDYQLSARISHFPPDYDASPLAPPPPQPPSVAAADPLADLDALGRIDLLGTGAPLNPAQRPGASQPVVPAEPPSTIDPGALDDLLGLPRPASAPGAPAFRGSEPDHLAPIHQPFQPPPAGAGPESAIPDDFDFLANTRFGSPRRPGGAGTAAQGTGGPLPPQTESLSDCIAWTTPPVTRGAAPAQDPAPPTGAPAQDAAPPDAAPAHDPAPPAGAPPQSGPALRATVPPGGAPAVPGQSPGIDPPATPLAPHPRAAGAPAAPAGSAAVPPAAPVRASAAAQPEILAALLDGLGGGQWPHPEDGGIELARLAGALLRETLTGTMAVLRARKAAQVEITRDYSLFGSNPLKVDPTIDAALLHMLSLRLPGYLLPLLAVRDAFKDIRSHEVGMVAGMQGLIEALLRELSPQRITERAGQQGGLGQLFSSSRKAQLWDTYEREYQILARVAGDDFFRLAGDAFAQAYAAAVDKLDINESN